MRSSEWVAFLYFLYLAGVCWLRPLPASRRLLVTAASVALAAAIWILASVAPSVVRDWTPFLYVSAGYYLTGRLFVKPSPALESWLLAWDRKLLGDPATRFLSWPGWLVTYLEIVYVLTFLLLPGGLRSARRDGSIGAGEPLLDDGHHGRFPGVRVPQRVPDAAAVGARAEAGARGRSRCIVWPPTWSATPRSA